MKINIAHLYPDLLNLYGDKGNIASMVKRLEWRGIEAQVTEYKLEDDIDFENTDIILLGGGTDREQLQVSKRLMDFKDTFKDYVEKGGVVLALCGGYLTLGEYYMLDSEKVEGLGILDIRTNLAKNRFIGDIVIKTSLGDAPVVGFENHAGRTDIGSHEALGQVVYGNGNNGSDKKEGVIYKNTIGTYLHGPVLPKNPHLCDRLLSAAVKNKDSDFVFESLDDTMEFAANATIVGRYVK